MTFGREKRTLLATLALLAPLPLPLNQVLEWPVLFVYILLIVYFLQRVDRGLKTQLPNWSLNLLGLIYFPILLIDLRFAFLRGRVVMALLHLILFLVVVKLYSMQREKDKWHIAIAIFFLFIGAMATSSHVAVVPYLILFVGAGLFLLARFAHFHVLAAAQQDLPQENTVSLSRPILAGVLIVLVLAVPLFAAMPRFRQPFIFGQGGGGSGLIRSTGFSESVDLNLTSSIRGNRQVAFRVQYSDDRALGHDFRFKAIGYDTYRDRQWHRASRETRLITPREEGQFQIASGTSLSTATLYLEPLNSTSLMLPLETLSLRLSGMPALTLSVDAGGGVSLPWPPPGPIRYELELGSESVFTGLRLGGGDRPLALDTGGVSDRIEQLARDVTAGVTSDEERILAIERHLLTEYGYTLDFVGRDGQNPIDDFLFEYRTGHCEYFASAMVMMLRSVGIPARLVTGFLGAEYNPLEGYFIVRQDNAHAWVEAYSETKGWQVYDPTPPEGRPAIAEQSLQLLVTQLYDYLTFRWDRYVLTFGADDQAGFFQRIKAQIKSWKEWWKSFFDEEKSTDSTMAQAGPGATDIVVPGAEDPPWHWWLLGLLVLASLPVAWGVWRYLHPQRAEIAYRRLRDRAARAGIEVDDALAPLELARLTGEQFPDSAEPIGTLIELYLEEQFADRPLEDEEVRRLGLALRQANEAIRRGDRSKAA